MGLGLGLEAEVRVGAGARTRARLLTRPLRQAHPSAVIPARSRALTSAPDCTSARAVALSP